VNLDLGSLLASALASGIGYVLFHYGRRSERLPQIVSGLGLMLFPMFVSGATAVLAVTGLILVGFWASLRAGL
jgi:hypothetical protein